MKKDTDITPVIFRKWCKDEIIAIFPTVPYSYEFETCMSYMHVGQHSEACPSHLMKITKKASEEEYSSLKKEIESRGYNLKVYKNLTKKLHEARYNEIENTFIERNR